MQILPWRRFLITTHHLQSQNKSRPLNVISVLGWEPDQPFDVKVYCIPVAPFPGSTVIRFHHFPILPYPGSTVTPSIRSSSRPFTMRRLSTRSARSWRMAGYVESPFPNGTRNANFDATTFPNIINTTERADAHPRLLGHPSHRRLRARLHLRQAGIQWAHHALVKIAC